MILCPKGMLFSAVGSSTWVTLVFLLFFLLLWLDILWLSEKALSAQMGKFDQQHM
jgi:cbb3-type cytochrome oxidase subunit 3